jgi:hypothetical protein
MPEQFYKQSPAQTAKVSLARKELPLPQMSMKKPVLIGSSSYDLQIPAPTKLPPAETPAPPPTYSKRVSQNELSDIRQGENNRGTIWRGI